MDLKPVSSHEPQVESAFASVPQQPAVTSQLMQNYRLATPFIAGSQISTALNITTNQTELFSIGSNGHIYNLYLEPQSDTGWSQIDLNFPGEAKYVVAGNNPDGGIVVYATSMDNTVYMNTSAQKGGTGWQVISTLPFYNAPAITTFIVLGMKMNYDQSARPFVTIEIVTQFNLPNQSFFFTLIDNQWVSSGRGWPASVMPAAKNWCTGFFETPTDGPGGSIGVAGVGLESPHLIGISLYYANIGNWGPSYIGYTYEDNLLGVRCAKNEKGFDELFVVRAVDGGVYYAPVSPNVAQWLTPVKLSDATARCTSLAATTDSGQCMHVFAVGEDSSLYHVRQDATSSTGWTTFAQLETSEKITQIIVGKNPKGIVELFAVTADARLLHIWQDLRDMEWHMDEVELPTSTTIEEFSSYSGQITVYDSNAVIAPNAAVKIYCDDAIMLDINGVTCFLEPNVPWEGVSNAAGQVVINLPTQSLGVSLLALWTTFMPATDRLVIDLSAPIQAQLAKVDSTMLLAAQVTDNNGQRTPLLVGSKNRNPEQVANIATAIRSAMSLAVPPPPHVPTGMATPLFHQRNDPRLTRYISDYKGTPLGAIYLPAVPEQHWQVDFSSGTLVHRSLTRSDAERLVVAQQQLPALPLAILDWGGLFNAIEDGFATITNFMVTTTAKGIQASFELIMDGVHYVYTALLTLRQQAVDLVEEIIKVVEVAFDQLFRWLGEIFDWPAILRSKEVLKHAIGQTVEFSKEALAVIETSVVGGIDGLEDKIKQAFAAIDALLTPTTSLNSLISSNTKGADNDVASLNNAMGMNVFFHGYINSATTSSLPVASAVPPLSAAISGPLDELIEKLETFAQQFQSTEVFADAINDFLQIAKANSQFAILTLALKGTLKLVEALTLLVFDLAKSLVQVFFAAISATLAALIDLLNAAVEIPFVSALYTHFTGTQLTLIDFMSILIATPATLLYKFADPQHEVPFPDQAAVQMFENNVSAAYLLQQSGLVPMRAATTLADGWTPPLNLRRFLAFCYATSNACYTVGDIFVDVSYNPQKPPPGEFFDWLTFSTSLTGYVCTIPWLAGEGGGLGWDDSKDFNNVVWLAEIASHILDVAFFVKQKKLARSVSPLATLPTGVANLVLTIMATVKDGCNLENTEGIIGQIPGLFKCVLQTPPPYDKVAKGGLVILDAICDGAATIMSFIVAIELATQDAQLSGRLPVIEEGA